MGPLGEPAEDAARASGSSSSGTLKVDERELDRHRGDHHLDDARGARATRRSSTARGASGSRAGPAPRAGREPARQAVRPDAEDDAPAPAGQDALAGAAGAAAANALPCAPCPTMNETWQYGQAHPRGRKNNPIWRVVAADQRSPRDGRFIEVIGHYNPQTEPSTIELDEERCRLARAGRPAERHRQEADGEGEAASQRPEGAARVPRPHAGRPARPGRGRRVRGGRRHDRARAERRRGRPRQGDRPRRPHRRGAARRS